jgi:two-component system, OmpR family, phosphate regulon sensor histidine kinase PhoR
MKKIKLPHIVFIISLALLVLVSLQIKNAYNLYNQTAVDFEARIDNILTKVAMRHEKASDFKRYSALFKNDISGQYKTALREEFLDLLPVQETVTISDTFIYEQGRKVKYLLIKGNAFDSIANVTVTHNVLARDITDLEALIQTGSPALGISGDTNDLNFQLDKRAMNNLFRKSKYINEFMLGAFRSVGDLLPNERIDLAFLDSIIHFTLEGENLKTSFKYVVFDETHQAVEFPAYTDEYELNMDTTKAYAVRLFPGNIFDEELMLYVSFPKKTSLLIGEMWLTLSVSILLVVLIFFSFHILFKTILNQRNLSEAKNDFISNMTHEFKTPISTISLACEALNDETMIQTSPEGVKPFVDMIAQENKRLSGLVEQILQSAIIDKGKLNLQKDDLELNELVQKVVRQFQLKVKERDGEIILDLFPGNLNFIGDPIHTANIISNLIDNGIKYSKGSPKIIIKTLADANGCKVSFTDHGIGIKSEHQDKIFDKLYRIPTGNVHDVKGFGLGLSYVKAIVDLQGWQINLKSKFGEGTTFTLLITND